MPAIAQYLQKRFKLTIEDGLPQAVIENDADWGLAQVLPAVRVYPPPAA